MNTALHFSTGHDEWRTPLSLFTALDAEFGFTLDAAAGSHNALCAEWRGLDHPDPAKRDGLIGDWSGTVWVNPPYSRGFQKQFIAKAAAERAHGVTTVMLLPARTDTRAFHGWIWDAARHQPRPGVEVRFLRGRLRFVGAPSSAPFPSMIVVFRGAPSMRAPA